MEPRIVLVPPKKLIGIRLRMSLQNNRTAELWRSFMPRRKEISGIVSTDLFHLQIFDTVFDYASFNPAVEYERWAAVEVNESSDVPAGMESYNFTGGWYAVFIHQGPPTAFRGTFDRIYKDWLPSSIYTVDKREHFELLGEKYKNGHPESEEEIWVPVTKKL